MSASRDRRKQLAGTVVSTFGLYVTVAGLADGRLDRRGSYSPIAAEALWSNVDSALNVWMSPCSDILAALFSVDSDRAIVEELRANNKFGCSTDAVVVRNPILDDAAVGVASLPRCRRVR